MAKKADGSKIMVNLRDKKRTHILLFDPEGTGRFMMGKPMVTKVTGSDDKDAGQEITFTVKKSKVHAADRMTVVIHSAKFKKAVKTGTRDVPASGNLTVTIAGGAMAIDTAPIPVNYIHDDDGCDEP
jgi:hypothetical protein